MRYLVYNKNNEICDLIFWPTDNKELSEEEPQYELSFMESVARLDVREAFLEDSGLYTCQATNKLGRDVTSGRVTVKCKQCLDESNYCFNIHWILCIVVDVNPFSTGTGWTLYKVYGGFRISYGTG